MKILRSIFLLFCFINFTHAEVVYKSKISIFGNEILIENEQLSYNIFQVLNVEKQEFNLRDGFHKDGEFIYCIIEPGPRTKCAFYLNFEGKGELSSLWRDRDFGKSSWFDVLGDKMKPLQGTGEIIAKGDHFEMHLTGKLAARIYRKLSYLYPDSVDQDSFKGFIKRGESISCLKGKEKNAQSETAMCTINVIVNQDAKDDKSLLNNIREKD